MSRTSVSIAPELSGHPRRDDAIFGDECVCQRRLAMIHVRQDADVANALGRLLQLPQQLRGNLLHIAWILGSFQRHEEKAMLKRFLRPNDDTGTQPAAHTQMHANARPLFQVPIVFE